jgi:hypothetical protein
VEQTKIAASFLACSIGLGSVLADDTDTSKSLSYATYKEVVDRVEVVVGSELAGVADHRKYLPLQIAIGVFGDGPELEITPGRFLLIDAERNILNSVPAIEIAREADLLMLAKQYNETNRLATGQNFALNQRIGSNFYPSVGGAFYVVTYLNRGTYLEDLLFFPRPEAGLEGVLTLRLLTPGMESSVDVRFEVPQVHKKRRKKKQKTEP